MRRSVIASVSRQERDDAELRARINALVAASAALATRIERIDESAAITAPHELRQQLSALVELIAEVHGCAGDAITFVEQRLKGASRT